MTPLLCRGRAQEGRSRLAAEHLDELGSRGWEAVSISLKEGDLVAWPVVLLKRSIG